MTTLKEIRDSAKSIVEGLFPALPVTTSGRPDERGVAAYAVTTVSQGEVVRENMNDSVMEVILSVSFMIDGATDDELDEYDSVISAIRSSNVFPGISYSGFAYSEIDTVKTHLFTIRLIM